MELSNIVVAIWGGCFVVVTVDSGWRKINPFFWFLASLVGGPFALTAYALVREKWGK